MAMATAAAAKALTLSLSLSLTVTLTRMLNATGNITIYKSYLWNFCFL